MTVNKKCPRCGSSYVQLTNERSKHGCLYFIIFGFFYLFWVMIKYFIGFCILIMYDWWVAIIKHSQGKGHVWQCLKWFSWKKRTYYCHSCGYNFKA